MSGRRGVEGWVFILLAAILSLTATVGLRPPYEFQVALLVVLVALLGLPHGALDLEIARAAGLWSDAAQLLRFGGVYVALVAMMILVWVLAPGLALVVFLGMSAWHFSGDWRQHLGAPVRLAVGGYLLALPALFHFSEVAHLFGLLAPEPTAWLVAEGLRWLAVVCVPPAVLAAISAHHLRSSLEIVFLGIAAAALSPLVYFAVYFCFLHSPRHLNEAASEIRLGTGRELIRCVLPVVVPTWLGAAGAAAVLPASLPSTIAVQVVFVGLSALTVPHMLLIEWWADAQGAADRAGPDRH